MSNTTRGVAREIKDGFVSAPKGCYIQLERMAARYILDNIQASYGNTAGLVSRAASFTEDSGLALTLANFLDYCHLDPRALYKFCTFSRICVRADVREDFTEPLENTMTKAFSRFAVIDSRRWIRFLLNLLPRLDDVDFGALSEAEQRMLQMFYVTVWGKPAENWSSDEVLDNLYALSDSPVLLEELLELLRYRYEQIDFIDERYIHHRERGSKVLLFVREFKVDRISGGAEAYTFLGTANYVKHDGSRPMNITWKLDRPIPAKFLKKTNKLVVG